MTTQIANAARLFGSMVELHLVVGVSPIECVCGKITGVDGVGVSILESVDAGEPGTVEQFFPWTSIGRIVLA